jgi:hypothetical protein
MASAALRLESGSNARHWDATMVALAGAHAALLIVFPVAPLIAIGVWWNSNTISHNFVHRPFFRRAWIGRAFSAYLSVLLGIPQSIWKQRHLAHHAGVAWRLRMNAQATAETALVVGLWSAMAVVAPALFATVYAPGYLAGLALCWLHGYYEHARGTTSHYGRLYNLLLFNDGYHVEHHADPSAHWTSLRSRVARTAETSRWPAPLRWLEALSLEGLERLTLRWDGLRRWVMDAHRRAIGPLMAELPAIGSAGIVGGGLHPRTALLVRELAPGARITIIDASAANLEVARRLFGPGARYVHAPFRREEHRGFDLISIPLAYRGDREAIYAAPPAPAVLVHDWIWRRRGRTRIVSRLLMKRVNLLLA